MESNKLKDVRSKVDKVKLSVYVDRDVAKKARHKMIDQNKKISELFNELLKAWAEE